MARQTDQPTLSEQQVLGLLNENNGDVNLVAREIGLSTRWVQKIKTMFWSQPDPEIQALVVPQSAPLATREDNEVVPYIAPDVERVVELRTKVLNELTASVADLKPRESIRLLEVLLMYENSLRASMAPNMNIYNDNRRQTVHVTQLVDALEEKLTLDQLRQVAGVDAPLSIVEGVVIPIGEEE